MDERLELIKGLTSEHKYLPVWYRYDRTGSQLNRRWFVDNKFYYYYRSEVSAINKYMQEMVNSVQRPYTLVELGSGNCEKTRLFIEAILDTQKTLKYVPNDIDTAFLRETSHALAREYGEKLNVQIVEGDYSRCIEMLKNIPGNKLILSISGGFQNMPYDIQIQRLEHLSHNMTGDDRLLVSLDVTKDATTVEQAYLDPTGVMAPHYLNGISRLNREYNGNIDTEKFKLQATFVEKNDPDDLSNVLIRAQSTCDGTYELCDLGISVSFKEGEYLCMYEGEGASCKYTQQQIHTLAARGNQDLDKLWIDDDNHVALCLFKKVKSQPLVSPICVHDIINGKNTYNVD